LNNKNIEIPEPSHQIETLLRSRTNEYQEEENDEQDLGVFEHKPLPPLPQVAEADGGDDDDDFFDLDDDDDYIRASKPSKGKGKVAEKKAAPMKNDWKHDATWVNNTVGLLMPPPLEASPSATMAVQRELAAMLKEQDHAKSLKELGWYMPPELIGDNLFQWIVELHSFDEALPIAKDLQKK